MGISLTYPSDCIQKNNYDESKCKAEIDALYECCNAFYEKYGDAAKTVSCPKANLLRLKMRQLAQEKGSK
ncbi:Cx9C motif-containing protein 4, mitochondrial [Pseudogymnoascus verrucosus]|jgi:hypothetical protein|uniref:Cx9C motif-containing protein 4, mitochondrial n=1 Tax=Pseudogymnoascus verrucosus TaxID=342668 RepID=A0A1B8GHH8_9PEZI|nr:Cx9C motif-containing protein 4, mitochondrial [Pseudogymnoascus verrucosus]OBT95303.2 Cx9C motif-containing protein 4, mitochondrial [Pseudogymnoascus verrucosus]